MKKSVKNYILAALLAVITVLSLFSETSYAASAKISQKKATILVSQSVQLSIIGNTKKVKWSSSNKKIAKVSSKGKVTGKKAGKATIKAKVGSKTYTCKITVKIGLSDTRLELAVGGTKKIKLCGTKIKKVASSNSRIAAINKNGTITAVAVGQATITVTGKNKKKYKCKVSVIEQQQPQNVQQETSAPDTTGTAGGNTPAVQAGETQYALVSFDTAGGSSIASQRIEAGQKASVPEIPSRSGYIFDHWELNGQPFDFSAAVQSDITLTSTWSPSGEQTWQNAKELKQVIDASIAPGVDTEKQVVEDMDNRGFSANDVLYDYSMGGTFTDEAVATAGSSEKKPMYYTYYISSSGELWTIYSVNGEVIAYPVYYNLNSGENKEVLVAEKEEITSYDNESNKYYVTVPDPDNVRVIVVEKIDADTLNSVTM